MYYLTVEHTMDAAHFLSGYNGKCQNIHGHQWKIVATIAGAALQDEGQEEGMLLDFGIFKRIVREKVDYFDHSLIIKKDSLDHDTLRVLEAQSFLIRQMDFRPTAECFAAYFFHQFLAAGLPIHEVSVYETPTNKASYRAD